MVKFAYGPDTGRLHGFVICDLSDVLRQIADEIVRCGSLFGKPWELRIGASLQCRADQRMCQQTDHAGFALVAPTISGNGDSSRRPQERRLVFFASQQRAETNDSHAKNRLSKQPQPAARNFWQRCSDTNRTTRRREPATQTPLANNVDNHRALTS